MPDSLLGVTALPNLHPALVHFPIALAAVALLSDAIVFVRRRWVSLDANGAFLWALAAAGGGADYLAGEQAAEDAGLLEGAAEVALGQHADAALATLIALSLLALFRVALAWRDRGKDRVGSRTLRAFALSGAFALQGLVAYTADLGGALVYKHGLAVSHPGAEAPAAAPQPSAPGPAMETSALEYLADGSVLWRPRAGDEAALGEVLEPLGPADVRVARGSPGSEGILLASSGRALLVLPGSWEDARIEAKIDTSAFRGSVTLGARVDGETNGGFLRLATAGEVALVALHQGQEKLLDDVERRLPAGEVTVALSVSGRHWKGFVDGGRVVHGHASLPAPGRMALLLDGTGTLRVVSVRITPMNGMGAAGTSSGEQVHQH
jgi:uncharacterized membrane protein